jgi:predicted Zn-dependent protease
MALQKRQFRLWHCSRAATVAVCFTVMLLAQTSNAWSQHGGIIRDAEIEATIRNLATPMLQAAGLPPKDVRIHLVNNNSINAFVAGGLQIFIYTGLLTKAETPNQIAGVLAHEIGHISGGHLARSRDALRGATATTILATVLGVAAAVVTGDGRALGAVAAGGQSVVQRKLLKYSRGQEAAADQAGLQFLEATGQSANGFSDFLTILGGQELLQTRQQDPYLRTHPFSRDRVASLQTHLQRSRYTRQPDSQAALVAHERMLAKLAGFLSPVGRVLRRYPTADQSVPAIYARAVAYHRRQDFGRADEELSKLLAILPGDPYFHELKGQLLLERGDLPASVLAYEKALTASSDEPQLVVGYARAVLQGTDGARINDAVKRLQQAVVREPDSGTGWRLLGTGYGRQGKLGKAALALAESEWRFGRLDRVIQQSLRAQSKLKKGSPDWLRAEDLQLAAQRAAQNRAKR